jgi:hypothetical protein
MKLDTNKLTIKDMVHIFDVTPMTIHNWKEGFDKKKTSKLPCYTVPHGFKHRVYFKWDLVKQWAKENEVEVVVTPSTLNNLLRNKLGK